MTDDTARMETDFPQLSTNLSTLSYALKSLTEIIETNGTVPNSVPLALMDTKKWVEKASDMASQVLERIPTIKPLQVRIEALTKDLKRAEARLVEKTQLHADTLQKFDQVVADLEKRHTEESHVLQKQVHDAASEVNRLGDVTSEVKRLKVVASEVERRLREAVDENIRLGAEASKHNRDMESRNMKMKQKEDFYEGRIRGIYQKIVTINITSKAKLDEKTRQLAEKATQLDETTVELNGKTAQLEEKTTQLDEVSQLHETRLEEIATLREDLTDARKSLKAARGVIRSKDMEHDAAIERLKGQYKNELDEQKSLIKQKEKEGTTWRGRYENLQGTIAAERSHLRNDYNRKVKDLQREMDLESGKLAAEKQDFTSGRQALVNENAALKSRVQVYDWYIPHLKEYLADGYRKAREALRSSNETLMEGVVQDHCNAVENHRKATADLESVRNQLQESHTNGSHLQEKLTTADSALESTQCELQESRANVLRLQTELAGASTLHGTERAELIKSHAVEMQGLWGEHSRAVARLQTTVDIANKDLVALRSRETDLVTQKQQADAEVIRLNTFQEALQPLVLQLQGQVFEIPDKIAKQLAQQKSSLDEAHAKNLQDALKQEKNDYDLALQKASQGHQQSLAEIFSKMEILTEQQQKNVDERDSRISQLVKHMDALNFEHQTALERKDAKMNALLSEHTTVLKNKDANLAHLRSENRRLEARKEKYKEEYCFYRDAFKQLENGGSRESDSERNAPTRLVPDAQPLPEIQSDMPPQLNKARQIVITHPSGQKRLHDAVEDEAEPRAPKKLSVAQDPVGAEDESGCLFESAYAPNPEAVQQDQEETTVEHGDVASAGADLATRIWGMFTLPGDLGEDDKSILLGQVQAICDKKKNIFDDVVAAIDHHVVGRFDQAPPEPRPCLMAQVMGQAHGKGGPRMTRSSCVYCKKSPKERLCCWARYVDGVASGYPPRVEGKVTCSTKDWNRTVQAEPLTVESNGQLVRWKLIRRKAHFQDPDY